MLHDELIYQFCTTGNEVEAYEILLLIVAHYMEIYDKEKERFLQYSNISHELVTDENVRQDYAMYLSDLLLNMRERTKAKEQELLGLSPAAFLVAMKKFVMDSYNRLESCETGNAKQISQLQVAAAVQENDSAARITKTWVAYPECCDVCSALNGITIPVDEPFLVNGQVVELGNGKEFIYNYIDRRVAIAHPNDRCTIEFHIEY